MHTVVKAFTFACTIALSAAAAAEPVTYDLDPDHTYPSFEADHMGGLSTWRGKFNRSSGTVVLDRAARTGSIDVTVDMKSVDFGHDEMNKHAMAADILDVERYPTAVFKGKFTEFDGDVPDKARGELTMHGVTRPITLDIDDFKCIMHPMTKREACGADVSAEFNRADYGIDFALNMGFKPEVELKIQVEGQRRQ
ncbi:YceI family protein [Bordetella muralis]|jgi:polyisoprenoid-binding protein YceI|uniref:YceI family protein n=1 Tax=Bordetella muralis TaxID=1649130 RepID=UPI0039F012A5